MRFSGDAMQEAASDQDPKQIPGGVSDSSGCDFRVVAEAFVGHWLRCQGLDDSLVEDVGRDTMADYASEHPVAEKSTGLCDCLRRATVNQLRQVWCKALKRRSGSLRVQLADIADRLDDPKGSTRIQWDDDWQRFCTECLLDRIGTNFHPNSVAAYREVMLNGRGVAEVAAHLGITVGTVRIAQSRVERGVHDAGVGLLD